MIVYFADRNFNILGLASTALPGGFSIVSDTKIEDVESGVASFECTLSFNKELRSAVEACAEVGNYILRKNGTENEFYTIIDSEIDTKNQDVYMYAEDAGLDLLNEVVGAYTADQAYNIAHYINKFANDSGFVIGINEVSSLTRKLSWDGEATATERIASVATQFGGCEISYSFDIDGMIVTNKYINIYKKRGQDIGVQLRLNRDIDRIITKKSIANLATSLRCTGGTPDGAEKPITLSGYEYDDGDFYVSGTRLNSRSALKKWSRYRWAAEPNQLAGYTGHIIKQYSYDTTSQKELCSHAVTELKKLCDLEVNYEVDIARLPENVRIGDTVNIVDDAGELYLSTRILKLESSIVEQTYTATLGEFLLKSSGISQKVADLADDFARIAAENQKAREEAAQAQKDAQEAQNKAEQAAADLESARQEAAAAQAAADEAKAQADAAAAAAAQAKADAADAAAQVTVAQSNAETAITKADAAQSTADTAKTEAADAKSTADAAKLDAQTARNEIAALGENLETVTTTMEADYSRKTDLTEAEARLQSQISQNAAQIESTVSSVTRIDETANDAKEQAAQAQNTANAAQQQAAQASTDADAAQTAADNAAAAAAAAQTDADNAATAATNAQNAAAAAQAKADAAQTDLDAAKQNLESVSSKADATEQEVNAAKQAVTEAQAAADQARADAQAAQAAADQAASDANTAQNTATTAKTAADKAQAAADEAKQAADDAKAAADALAVRVTTAETNITQNSEQIALRATKEEVATAIDSVNETVINQKTEIVAESESIVMSALESYVQTGDYDEFKSTVESQFQILSDEISMQFTSTNTRVEEVDGELQARTNEISKHIGFSDNGIILNSGGNNIELQLDNEVGFVFAQNGNAFGHWDGENFYTGNIVIRTNERAQFGNFAFVPRANGDMTFLDVGGMFALLKILRHPSSVTCTTSDSATFTVTAMGSGDLSYQWQYKNTADDGYTNFSNGENDGFSVSGATANSITISAFTAEISSMQIRCAVTDSAGDTAESNAATLNVTL